MTDCGILQHCSIGDWGSLVGGFASLVGSVLLYLTLKFQHKTFRQERFENVFFNMLDYHRKVTESIKIVVQEMEADTKIVSREYKGRTFFTFFEREIGEIKKSLTSKKHLGMYDKFNDPISIEVAESKINEENLPEGYEEERLQKKQEVWDLYRTRHHNLIYDITPEKHELAKKSRIPTLLPMQSLRNGSAVSMSSISEVFDKCFATFVNICQARASDCNMPTTLPHR